MTGFPQPPVTETPSSNYLVPSGDTTGAVDTARINTAVAAGGEVILDAGTFYYNATTQLQPPAGTSIRGVGMASTTIQLTGGANGFLQLNAATCTLQDLTLQRGNATNPSRLLDVQGGNCQIIGVRFDGQSLTGTGMSTGTGSDGLRVSGCIFLNVSGLGFGGNNCNYFRLTGNRWIGHLANACISLNTNCKQFVIANNTMIQDASNLLAAVGCYTSGAGTDCLNGTITGNYIESALTAIVVQLTAGGNRPGRIAIVGNTIKILANGAGAGASWVSLANADGCTVTGNTCDSNGFTLAQGIEVVNSNYCQIGNNHLRCGTTVPYGVFLNQSTFCTVTGNTIRDLQDTGGANGIRLFSNSATGCTDNTVTGNTILFTAGGTGTVKVGILLTTNNAAAACSRNTVVGNTVYGDGSANNRGVSLNNNASGVVANNTIYGNTLQNCVLGFHRSGDTNTIAPGILNAQSSPGNPTGTTSTSGVMMGLAGAYTPLQSGSVLIVINGDVFNNTVLDGATLNARTGTGGAPTNGAALTGTIRGGTLSYTAAVASDKTPFSLNAIVTGLTVGTAIWIDVALAAVTGGTATIENISLSVTEL